jgi:bacterioferritin (cytochrome b1)
MKAGPKVIAALDECLKYERTLAGCCGAYHQYFQRWRIHRLEKWFDWNRDAACHRAESLADRISVLDAIPGQDHYDFEVEEIEDANDISKVWDYFETMLTEARDEYEKAAGAAKDAGDSVSAHVCGHNQVAIEEMLGRIEAKQFKVKIVGAVEYLAHHMHNEG